METVSGYSFKPDDLRVADRRPGISGFMRIRNGEDFLEAAIRSHIDAFDEIVAVHNQSTDRTVAILQSLAAEFGPKIRLYHYADRVHPPGSEAHATEPAHSPNSLVNYYNFALSRTTRTIVTKLDDDHLAMPAQMQEISQRARDAVDLDRTMYCFSGVNLARLGDRLGIPAADMLCGNGDHWFFRVSPDTFFEHDRRFEKLRHRGLRRRFEGFAYWHLKYLKPGLGFDNYELDRNPNSRYARRRERLARRTLLTLPEFRQKAAPSVSTRIRGLLGEKPLLLLDRSRAVPHSFPQPDLVAALDELSPGWCRWISDAR